MDRGRERGWEWGGFMGKKYRRADTGGPKNDSGKWRENEDRSLRGG